MAVNTLRRPVDALTNGFANQGHQSGSTQSAVDRIKTIFSKYEGQIQFSPAFACSSSDGRVYILLDKENRLVGVQTPKDTFKVTESNFFAKDEQNAIAEILEKLARTSIDKAKSVAKVFLPINGAIEVRRIPVI